MGKRFGRGSFRSGASAAASLTSRSARACAAEPCRSLHDRRHRRARRGRLRRRVRDAILALKRGERAYLDPLARLLAPLVPAGTSIVPRPHDAPPRRRTRLRSGRELARRVAALRGGWVDDVLVKRGRSPARASRVTLATTARGRFRSARAPTCRPRAIAARRRLTTARRCATPPPTLHGRRLPGERCAWSLPSGRATPPGRETPRRDATVGRSVKAIWNGAVLAESNSTEVVEGNQYFPPDSIKREYFKDSATTQRLPVEGHRVVLHRRRQRQAECRRRVVLSDAERRGEKHRGLRRVLEGRRGHAVDPTRRDLSRARGRISVARDRGHGAESAGRRGDRSRRPHARRGLASSQG